MKSKTKFTNEYLHIKHEILKLNKEDIFETSFFINFCTEVYNFLKYFSDEDFDRYNLEEVSLTYLFEFYIKNDENSINKRKDIIKLINDYNKFRQEEEEEKLNEIR